MYKLGLGKMTNKGKETTKKHATSETSLTEHSFGTKSISIASESPELSQAMSVISGSAFLPGITETETDNGKVSQERSMECTSTPGIDQLSHETYKPDCSSTQASQPIMSSSNVTMTNELENGNSEPLVSGKPHPTSLQDPFKMIRVNSKRHKRYYQASLFLNPNRGPTFTSKRLGN